MVQCKTEWMVVLCDVFFKVAKRLGRLLSVELVSGIVVSGELLLLLYMFVGRIDLVSSIVMIIFHTSDQLIVS